MAQPLYANNVAGTIAANIGPADTGILLGAGQGSLFPAITAGNWYYATLVHVTLGTIEIVKVTAKSADTLTVVRGQDGTAAASFTTGSLVELRLHAQMLRELDYRSVMGVASGLATLDGSSKLTAAQLPTNVALLVGGLIPDAQISTNIARTSALGNYLPIAGGTVTGALSVTGNLTVDTGGAGGSRLNVGNDAWLQDCNMANTMSLRGVANAAVGYLAFGSSNHTIGWNGTYFLADGQMIWTATTFDPNTKLNASSPTVFGNLSMASGNLLCDGLQSNGGNLVLGAVGGAIYLRPYGLGSGTNQGIVNASGLAQFVDIQSYSDARFKKGIKAAYADIDIARNLQLKTWKRRADNAKGWGLVAQDLLEAGFERHVGGTLEDGYSVDYGKVALEVAMSNDLRIRRLEKACALGD